MKRTRTFKFGDDLRPMNHWILERERGESGKIVFSSFTDKEDEGEKEECWKLKMNQVYKGEKVTCKAFYILLENEEIFF